MADYSVDQTSFIVFLSTNVGINLRIIQGHLSSASEIIDFLLMELGLGAKYSSLFSLWAISPSLELQLKPEYIVYDMLNQWQYLMQRYGINDASDDQDLRKAAAPIGNDEIDGAAERVNLYLYRNIFYPVELERKIEEDDVIKMLYNEAYRNVMDGKYPCDDEDYFALGGLIAFVLDGPYDGVRHTTEFYKWRRSKLLPDFVIEKHSGLFKRGVIERKLEAYHSQLLNLDGQLTRKDAQQKYLAKCWELPIYGAAFFPTTINVGNKSEEEVYVAVNVRGFYVLNRSKHDIFLRLSHRQFKHMYLKCKKDGRQSIVIKFEQQNSKHPQRPPVARLLQMFSPQCLLISSLITTMAGLSESRYANTSAPEHRSSLATGKRVWANNQGLMRLPSFGPSP